MRTPWELRKQTSPLFFTQLTLDLSPFPHPHVLNTSLDGGLQSTGQSPAISLPSELLCYSNRSFPKGLVSPYSSSKCLEIMIARKCGVERKKETCDKYVLQGASWYLRYLCLNSKAAVLHCAGKVGSHNPMLKSPTWGDGRDKALGSEQVGRSAHKGRSYFLKEGKNCNGIVVSKENLALSVSHGRSQLKIATFDLGWLPQTRPFHHGLPNSVEDA